MQQHDRRRNPIVKAFNVCRMQLDVKAQALQRLTLRGGLSASVVVCVIRPTLPETCVLRHVIAGSTKPQKGTVDVAGNAVANGRSDFSWKRVVDDMSGKRRRRDEDKQPFRVRLQVDAYTCRRSNFYEKILHWLAACRIRALRLRALKS
jgi:hypothetical protein